MRYPQIVLKSEGIWPNTSEGRNETFLLLLLFLKQEIFAVLKQSVQLTSKKV